MSSEIGIGLAWKAGQRVNSSLCEFESHHFRMNNKPFDPYTDDPEVVKAINRMSEEIRDTIDAEILREIMGIAEGWKKPTHIIVKNDIIKSIINLHDEVERNKLG